MDVGKQVHLFLGLDNLCSVNRSRLQIKGFHKGIFIGSQFLLRHGDDGNVNLLFGVGDL